MGLLTNVMQYRLFFSFLCKQKTTPRDKLTMSNSVNVESFVRICFKVIKYGTSNVRILTSVAP